MSRAEGFRLERGESITFEGGTISGVWQVEVPRGIKKGTARGFSFNFSLLEKSGWRDQSQGVLYHPQGKPVAVELAVVKFDRAMTNIEGEGSVLEWLERYNTDARQFNQVHGLTPDDPRAKPLYALANRFQLLAWRTDHSLEKARQKNKMFVVGNSFMDLDNGERGILHYSASVGWAPDSVGVGRSGFLLFSTCLLVRVL